MSRLVDHPGVTANGKTIGRPRKHPPDDAAATIRELVGTGHTLVGVAQALGASADVLRRWLDEHPALKEAFDHGREKERHVLHNVLFEAATQQGNIVAAMFLLKTKHNYRENGDNEAASRVQITFSLPGALKPEQFTIQADDRSTQDQPVSRPSLERS